MHRQACAHGPGGLQMITKVIVKKATYRDSISLMKMLSIVVDDITIETLQANQECCHPSRCRCLHSGPRTRRESTTRQHHSHPRFSGPVAEDGQSVSGEIRLGALASRHGQYQ